MYGWSEEKERERLREKERERRFRGLWMRYTVVFAIEVSARKSWSAAVTAAGVWGCEAVSFLHGSRKVPYVIMDCFNNLVGMLACMHEPLLYMYTVHPHPHPHPLNSLARSLTRSKQRPGAPMPCAIASAI